MNNYI